MNDSHVKVVIVGAGFAGLNAAKLLGKQGIDVVLIDRRNYHLFQPLLYQVATASLSPAEIAEPIRKVMRPYRSVEVVFGEVVEICQSQRQVRLRNGHVIGYSHLIVAAGATDNYFGNEGWRAIAPGLKSVQDARTIRTRVLAAFEHAEMASDQAERERLMTFAVVGGGPTGVELAGAIAEIARRTLAHDFRHIDPASAKVMLIEGGDRILSGFDPEMSADAARRLAALGVDIRLSQRVEVIEHSAISIAGERITVGTVIWAAGVQASPVGAMLTGERDRSGRVHVNDRLALPSDERVFVLGDLAHVIDVDGNALPGLAQVAKQQGQYLGRELGRHLRDGSAMMSFRYRSRGIAAIVGRHAAIFQGHRVQLRGGLAWFFWAAIHIYLLVGFQNRMLVSMQWLWRYLTDERGARLIMESQPDTSDAPKDSVGRDRLHAGGQNAGDDR